MTLKTIQEYYPVNKAVVGYFDSNQTFVANTIEDINYLSDSFFTNQNGFFDFIEYIGNHKFRVWTFGYTPIIGYYTTGDADNFYPMTYNKDCGYEIIEFDTFYNGLQNVLISPEYGEKLNIKIVLNYFSSLNPIFTTLDELREFLLNT